MNTTTKAQREQWIARALQLIKLDYRTALLNGPAVVEQLMKEFSISHNSARTATAKAARRVRGAFRP